MAKQQFNPILKKLLRNAQQLDRKLTSNQRFWLLRSGFLTQQPEGGFILPTVTLLLLMLSLVLGLLIFRTGNRTNQVITERQQRQIYNATTPAIERAKAKLEFLFTEDTLPALPSELDIAQSLKTDGELTGGDNPEGYGRYTLKDETRVDLNGDGTKDNAWTFKFDADGDGTEEIDVGYSILTLASSDPTPNEPNNGDTIELQSPDADKAASLVVRNGPINLSSSASSNCPDPGLSPFQGWQNVTGSALRKSLQVHAFARNPTTGVVSTLEMQQDKQASLGNKWGAWFRNDMEIFPGPPFNWNGAMYVAGSYFVGGSQVKLYPISSPSSCVYRRDNSEILMGEVPNDILTDNPETNGGNPFLGHFATGTLRDNNFNAGPTLYQHSEPQGVKPPANRITDIRSNNDSVDGAAAPVQIALDPVLLLTKGHSKARAELNGNARNNTGIQDANWANRWWVEEGRLYNNYQPTPFVDDTYRADDRWGPKPIYSDQPLAVLPPNISIANPSENSIKDDLTETDVEELSADEQRLLRNSPPSENVTDEESYGLDGYWERRAIAQGVRVIVGQRLELGNANGWATEWDANGDGSFTAEEDLNNNGLLDFDPLYPPPVNATNVGISSIRVDPDGADNRDAVVDPNNRGEVTITGQNITGDSSVNDRAHEMRQWKTLRDNAAAAQSATIYHYLMAGGQHPLACIASAAHPGTRQTIAASTHFDLIPNYPNSDQRLNVNFLTGEGTNGWEFYPPEHAPTGAVTSATLETARTAFTSAINDDDGDLRNALHNLAYFAGDPAGAFPPFQDSNTEDAASMGEFRNANQLDADLGPVVHPYPIQSMWGDFSNLRRIMDKLEGNAAYRSEYGSNGATYAQLSPADRTTLQTASCTLGMLAYNIDNIQNHPDALDNGNEKSLGTLEFISAIRALENDGITINGDDIEVDYIDFEDDDNDGDVTEQLTFKAKSDGGELFNIINPAASAVKPEILLKALRSRVTEEQYRTLKAVTDRQQIIRDRSLGFSLEGMTYTLEFGNARVLRQQIFESDEVHLQCDFIANDYFGLGKPKDPKTENQFLTLALTLCPSQAKYPSLAYLFPIRDHAHDGKLANESGLEPEQVAAYRQPNSEPYTSDNLYVNGTTAQHRFDNAYTFNRSGAGGDGSNWSDGDDVFRVIGDRGGSGGATANNGILEPGEEDLSGIILQPKNANLTSFNAWSQPNTSLETSDNNDDEDRINRITFGENNTPRWLAFLDKGIFNGREAMASRVMDIDLDLLRREIIDGENQLGGTADDDWWLPLPQVLDSAQAPTRTGAAIYAFREDTVREDGVARPSAANANWSETAWLAYVNSTNIGANDPLLMDAVSDNFRDPPVNPDNGISPKAVDFYPDPDRRVHGFRLRNGIDLRRVGSTAAVSEPLDDIRGMSFISDNPVYVQGHFNIHSTTGEVANIIQEFRGADGILEAGWNADDFYGRTEINPKFARTKASDTTNGDGDSWRPTEVAGDGISLLSSNFSGTEVNFQGNSQQYLDGWIAQGIMDQDGNFGDSSSFRSLNEPNTGRRWVREDGTVAGTADADANNPSPIKISQRGFPVYCSDASINSDNDANNTLTGIPDGSTCAALGGEEREYGLRDNNAAFRTFAQNRQNLEASTNDTYMNMLMVSGTIPSRADQSNGGLHNFPRFLENFGGRRMWIAGSIYQINFSNTATGPFDQDAWEPGSQPLSGSGNGELIRYYAPPNRLWGYDPALQLVQPAPIAQRFATPANIRSEFYKELPVDDPYIINLRCAVDDPSADADPSITCP